MVGDPDGIRQTAAGGKEVRTAHRSRKRRRMVPADEALVDSIDGIVWEADPLTFQFTFVSKQAERLLGYPIQQWLEEPDFWTSHVHPSDREWVFNLCVTATRDKSDHEFEYRMLAADGRVVWLRDIVSVVVEDDRPVQLRGVMTDITARKDSEHKLLELMRGTSEATPKNFFRELTRRLATVLGARFAAVTETADNPGMLRMLAVWTGDDWGENIEYEARGTPCGMIVNRAEFCCFPTGVQELFPDDDYLVEMGVESYLGAPLVGAGGNVIGHLCVLDDKPLWDDQRAKSIMTIFAARAAAELDRQQHVQALRETEQRLRDHNAALLNLAKSDALASSDFPRFTRLACRIAANTLGCERVGLWLFNDDRSRLRCENVYELSEDRHSSGVELEALSYPRYFEALSRGRVVAADDAHMHHGTSEFSESYLAPLGIRSMLDAPVRQDGKLRGVVCHEHVGPARTWTQEEQDFGASVADLVSLALEASARHEAQELARKAQKQLFDQQQRERHRVQSELDRVKDEVVRHTRLAAIGQVAASIAHELRNPLGAIRNAEFYLKRRVPDNQLKWHEYLDIIDDEVRAADRIVGNLLDMTRTRRPVKESVDLGAAAQEVFNRVGPPATVRLRLVLDPNPLFVDADPDQLRQVLDNLLANAIQAMDDRGLVTIRGKAENGFYVVTVEDNGPGIAPENQDMVFEPLFTTKAKGTGLGLLICKQIVERHRGTIELVKDRARGTAFRFRLPRLNPTASAGS